MNPLLRFILVAHLILLVMACTEKVKDELVLSSRVDAAAPSLLHDNAELLSESEQFEIASLVASHNDKGPGKIAVLTVPEIPGDISIEEYASEYLEAFINSEIGKSHGILLLVAAKERKLRIQTSKDVRGLLNDEECVNIIKWAIAPEFKKENYFSGIKSGLMAIIQELEE